MCLHRKRDPNQLWITYEAIYWPTDWSRGGENSACLVFTYKLHGAVVGEEFLHLDAPVWPQFEVSGTLWGLAQVAAPWIDFCLFLKGVWTHKGVQTVLTETPGEERRGQGDAWEWAQRKVGVLPTISNESSKHEVFEWKEWTVRAEPCLSFYLWV